MKKICYIIIAFAAMMSLDSCKEDKIMLYEDSNYVQFTKYLQDSSVCSFLAYPNDNQLRFPLEVEVVGFPSAEDRDYKVVVVKDYTDATEDNYQLPGKFTMPAGKVIDTCWITAIRTEEISQKAVRLAVRLEETPDFRVGQENKIGAILYISNVIAKPDWWTSTVTGTYLGDYSDKKYRIFIQVTGKAEIDSSNAAELRYYTIILKNYLLKEKDAGRTVYEEDGTEMTVKFVGG